MDAPAWIPHEGRIGKRGSIHSNAAIIETGQNKGGAVPGHTAANSVKHSSWKHGEGVYPASRGW